jgi:DNA-binding transcriptional regulator YiaG
MRPFYHLVLRAIRGDSPPWADMPQTFPEPLKKYRLQANLSQTALAVKLGVTLGAIGRWERGRAVPNRRSWPELRALLA